MTRPAPGLDALDRHRALAPLVIRAFVGTVLVWGTQDNVFQPARMLEFRDFLAASGFPAPLFCAYLSAYAQFACGLLVLAGAAVRPAALAMTANFLVALGMVHTALPFQQNIAPLSMLAGSLYLLLNGAGPLSVDEALRSRSPAPAARVAL
ncbi:MAG TPA: DoxX family protein [Longimicrobiaceae bacterium]|nr:DoxX family protein [Longimicrobiaceae bacterium]